MQPSRQALSDLVSERSRHPRFEGPLDQIDRAGSAINPYCGDAVSVALALDPTGQRLQAVRCSAQGCSLCKASADLMAEHLEGLSLEEATQLHGAFHSLLQSDQSPSAMAQPLALFASLRQVPSRTACALLPWQALAKALGWQVSPGQG